jgi:hypothetical protein
VHDFILEFKKECELIASKVYTNNPSLVRKLKIAGEDKYKTQSRVISYWFQIIENHLVWIMYKFLVSRNIIKSKHCGLEMDGICIPPVKFEFNKDTTITDLNNLIIIETGLDVKFKFKDYDEKFVLNDIIEQRETVVFADEIIEDSVEVIAFSIEEGIIPVLEVIPQIVRNSIINDLSESGFAKVMNSKIFNGNVIFTGVSKDPDGYMFNNVYWKDLSIHNSEIQGLYFDKL